jgi:hypothetical protein
LALAGKLDPNLKVINLLNDPFMFCYRIFQL